VAEILAIEVMGREEERDRARGHEVPDADLRADADPLRALPALDLVGRLEEAAALPGRVARARDRDGIERARVDVRLDAREVEPAGEEALERAVVQERDALVAQERAEEESHDPTRGIRDDTGEVGAIDVPRLAVPPDLEEIVHRAPEVVGVHR